jgi:CheY-like chemotaxis protein
MSQQRRILIVDDNAPLAENLLEIFEDEGIEGTVCNDPVEALESLGNGESYDLVVTDFRMPNMDGVELARHIKERRPQLPVIMLSAYLGDVDVDAAREAGVQEVMCKPQDLQRLIDRVSELGGPGIHATGCAQDVRG